MAIQISGEAQAGVILENMTPRQIVAELDKFVVGQRLAKRAVAIALRNRWRRQQLPPEVAGERAPKNNPMIGPTGGAPARPWRARCPPARAASSCRRRSPRRSRPRTS